MSDPSSPTLPSSYNDPLTLVLPPTFTTHARTPYRDPPLPDMFKLIHCSYCRQVGSWHWTVNLTDWKNCVFKMYVIVALTHHVNQFRGISFSSKRNIARLFNNYRFHLTKEANSFIQGDHIFVRTVCFVNHRNNQSKGGSRIQCRRGRRPSKVEREANVRFCQIFQKTAWNREKFGP